MAWRRREIAGGTGIVASLKKAECDATGVPRTRLCGKPKQTGRWQNQGALTGPKSRDREPAKSAGRSALFRNIAQLTVTLVAMSLEIQTIAA
jgi:hypothetical protein